jgi:hypothetical protein
MAAYQLIITDVTCYGSLYCVAGWAADGGRMIRPEPPSANMASEPSKFWDARFAGPRRLFAVGNVVTFEARRAPADFPFPHATEDRIVDMTRPRNVLRTLDEMQTASAVAAGVSQTLEAAFDGGLVRAGSGKAYVPAGHAGCSLGAVEVSPEQISFFEDSYQGSRPKLRAELTIAGVDYDLSVPADAVRTRWKAAGLAGLRADLNASHRAHLRVGLSRPFPAMPNQCYAQINGIYFL